MSKPETLSDKSAGAYPEIMLLPQHESLLGKSGISSAVATARGYRSANKKAEMERLGFAKVQCHVPALLIPVYSAVTGGRAFFQARPDDPRITPEGKTVKYETPAGVNMAVDAHPSIREQLRDPAVPLWVTEGIRKADAAISRGLCCIAILGVWNWRGTNEYGGKTALPDWEVIALNGRQGYIAYDSDAMTKPEVYAALERLAGFLKTRGARVQFVYLPAGEGGVKVGLDDYLAAGHSVEDLLALATPDLRHPAPRQSAAQDHDAVPPLDTLLESTAAFLQRFVAFPSPHHVTACALWAAHTWVYDRFDVSPFLHVSSPERRSGKTRLLEVMELLVQAPWRIISPSEAVLFRKIDREHPVLLLDEVDTIFGRGRDNGHEPLRALLNAGNRRGVTVPRCVGEGADMEIVGFSVFTPKVLAGIGVLPDTVADRSIPIRLQRRAQHEHVERFRMRDAAEEARPIQDRLERWATGVGNDLGRARPEVPEALNDRAGEIWEPLLTIADLAGGDWPERAREASVALHGDPTVNEETAGVLLLRAIREAFDEHGADRISTEDLVNNLSARDDIPLPEWWHRARKDGDLRGIGRWLGRRLRQFEVTVRKIRTDKGPVQGYSRSDFENAFTRYAPIQNGGSIQNNGTTTENQGSAHDSVSEHPNGTDPLSERRQPLQDMACSVVPSSGALGVEAETSEMISHCPPKGTAVHSEDIAAITVQPERASNGSGTSDEGDGRGRFILDMGKLLGFPRLDIGHGEAIATGAAAWGRFVTKGTPEQICRAAATLARDTVNDHDRLDETASQTGDG